MEMKKLLVFAGLWIAILLSMASCQPLQPIQSYPDYYKGRRLADVHAKKDVIDGACFFHRTRLNTTIIMKNLKKHITALTPENSESFIQGFSHNYSPAYKEYTQRYCDDFFERDP
ncbi:MAG: hypothetical protein JEZ12_02565 [Desulfobacterium sp.]|nr:hypothetical protein [Desulfobacterium sp.]